MDNFHEEIVSRKQVGLYNTLYILFTLLMVVCGMMAAAGVFALVNLDPNTLIGAVITAVVFGGLTVFLFWKKDSFKAEYEYAFTNGFTEIAVVYNNSRRKELLSFKMKDVSMIEPLENAKFAELKKTQGVKYINASLNAGAQKYFLFIERADEKFLLVVEPSEELVALMKQYATKILLRNA